MTVSKNRLCFKAILPSFSSLEDNFFFFKFSVDTIKCLNNRHPTNYWAWDKYSRWIIIGSLWVFNLGRLSAMRSVSQIKQFSFPSYFPKIEKVQGWQSISPRFSIADLQITDLQLMGNMSTHAIGLLHILSFHIISQF